MSQPAKHPRPSSILVHSSMAGLAALVRLAEGRSSPDTERYVSPLVEKWSEAKTTYLSTKTKASSDFSAIQDAEHVLRQQFLKMIWHSTRRYGNTEFKRVYSWREGTVGPINGLLNYAGARMRDLAVTLYPFPKPEYYQIRQYPDGSAVTIPHAAALKMGRERGVKIRWRAGYSGNKKAPRFLLSHPSMPELDFVDMIRAHVFELCRQLFIYAVPTAEAHSYIRRLVLVLRSFLDWVYSGGHSGRKDFYPEADRELRSVVLEVRTLYTKRTAPVQHASQDIQSDSVSELSLDDIRGKATRAHAECQDPIEREEAVRVLDLIDSGVVVKEDAKRLARRLDEMAQQEGNDWHRVLLSQFHAPHSFRQAVFHGDSMLDQVSEKTYVAEVPLDTRHGKGMADLMLSVRRSVGGRTVWTPVGVFEIKTKTAFDVALYGLRPRTKKQQVFVPEFYLWKRTLTDEEWRTTATSVPPLSHMDQLALYEQAIIQEYSRFVPNDPFIPRSLWKGVFVLDTAQEYSVVAEALAQTTRYLAENLDHLNDKEWTFTRVNDMMVPRMALLMCPERGPSELLTETVPPDGVLIEDPFVDRVSDERVLTEYVSVASPMSGGRAAAWYSKNWHLLNHIMEVGENGRVPIRVAWLDLLDELPPPLRDARLGMEMARRTGEISGRHYSKLRSLVENTDFLPMAAGVTRSLNHGSDSELLRALSKVKRSRGSGDEELIVVVDGWDELSQTMPTRLQGRVRALEQTILDALPRERTNIVWVSEGVQHTANSTLYQTKCLRPLEHDSPRRHELDEVIWNVPVRPRVLGWQAPWSTEHRVIVQDTPTDVPPWRCMITVPHIADWAARFRGAASHRKTVPRSEVMAVTAGPMHGRLVTLSSVRSQPVYLNGDDAEQLTDDALSLVPSLLRPRGTESKPARSSTRSEPALVTQVVTGGRQPTLVDRVHLALGRAPPEPSRARNRYVPARMITRAWVHKSTHEDETDEKKKRVSRCPPQYGRAELSDVDTTDIRKRELRRVLRAARYLRLSLEQHDELYSLCDEVIVVCHGALRETDDDKTPLAEPESRERYKQALIAVRDLLLARTRHQLVWTMLRSERESILEVLTSYNRTVLAMALEEEPDLITLYGHNLFLALIVAMSKASDDPAHPAVVSLWKTVARWQLYQMGFKPTDLPEPMARPTYDIGSVYSGLLWRARTLLQTQRSVGTRERLTLPETQASHRLGLSFSAGVDEPLWVLLPSDDGSYAIGLTGSVTLGAWWTKCVIDPDKLRAAAQEMLNRFESESAMPLLVTCHGHERLLSLWDEENQAWRPMGTLVVRCIKGHEHQLDWLRIDEFSSGVQPPASAEIAAPGSRDLGVVVRRLLKRLAQPAEESVQVECSVGIDLRQSAYRVAFCSGGAEVGTFITENTETLARTLREPQRAKLKDERGRIMFWDSRRGIDYHSVGLIRSQVEGSWTFRGLIPCPGTASELLSAETGEKVRLVLLEQQSHGRRVLHLKVRNAPRSSVLRELEDRDLTATEMRMLCASRELYDSAEKSRHEIVIDASHVTDERLLHDLRSENLGCNVVGLERETKTEEFEPEQDEETEMPYEEHDWSEAAVEELLENDGREMRLVRAAVYRSRMDYGKKLVVYVTPTDSSGDMIERTVLRQIVHEGTMTRGEVEEVVNHSLRNLILSQDEIIKAHRAVVKALRSEGVRVVRGADD